MADKNADFFEMFGSGLNALQYKNDHTERAYANKSEDYLEHPKYIEAAEKAAAAQEAEAAANKLVGDRNGQYCSNFTNLDDLIAKFTELAKEQVTRTLRVNNVSIEALDFTQFCCAIQNAFPDKYFCVDIVQCSCSSAHGGFGWDFVNVSKGQEVHQQIDYMLRCKHDINKIQIVNVYI